MNWDLITNVILLSSFLILAVFGVLGLVELITRKSLKKVDKPLLRMLIPLALTAITYIVFDKFWILNVRPDGSGEPSFPSSHVLAVATIFALVAIALPSYVKSKTARAVLYLLMLALTVLVSVGRVLANKHWPSDVAGALGFAAINALIYYLIIKEPKK
ncbi:phosphatase PAP2 family protein [Candidatus Saccharibacteria bacterium]|nr:phosphatase PAP2 family protein [Candidatus Saccharibacteria bacterium]